MKRLPAALALIVLLLAACTPDRHAAGVSDLDIAEAAYADGRYASAQNICDSLVLGSSFGSLNVSELCRLSMLFMHLGENSGDEGATTAMATRCLSEALAIDPDSTMAIIRQMPSDDRGRAIVLTALYESAQTAGDSLMIHPDSIPDNEL
ncbi:MAG: hypothetical protein NC131_21055 [Roseburia sp.]|nr:hypothetical protein [Roseburia sp.]